MTTHTDTDVVGDLKDLEHAFRKATDPDEKLSILYDIGVVIGGFPNARRAQLTIDRWHNRAVDVYDLDPNDVTRELGDGIAKGRKRAEDRATENAELDRKVIALDDRRATDVKQNRAGLKLWWHGDADANADRTWLVDGLLPEIGTAIMAGPWGSYKTFVVLDLALSMMRRESFAGRAVSKRCGVLFIAAEGAFEVPIRLQGAYETSCEDSSALPFARADECPRLLDRNALAILEATAKEAADRIQSKHGLGLGAIIIDTMAAAAGFDDENSNAEAQRAMNVLSALSHRFKCLVLVVDHFGKTAETGTRGGSAKEGSADAVLAILAERDLSGNVSNSRMAIRKVRGAPTGSEIPFGIRVVDLGNDKNGKPQSTLVVEWKLEGTALKKTSELPPSLKVFHDALISALLDHGSDLTPFAGGPTVRAVNDDRIRTEFYERYPADGDTAEKRQEARKKAYGRGVRSAQARRLIGVKIVDDDVTMIWRTESEPSTATP